MVVRRVLLGFALLLSGCGGGPELGTDPCTGADVASNAPDIEAMGRMSPEALEDLTRQAERATYWLSHPDLDAEEACRAASRQPAASAPAPSTDAPEPAATVAELDNDTRGRICRAAIASVMGRDPAIIGVESVDGDVVRTRYVRDDGTTWRNQCRVHADGRVEWAAVDIDGPSSGPGRWRSEDDIRFSLEAGGGIHIRQSSMGEVLDDRTYVVR